MFDSQAAPARVDDGAQPMLLYIAGAGHSGSTLLDLLLGGHSQIRSMGEVHRLGLYARTNLEPCTCGTPVRECAFWQAVAREAAAELGVDENDELLTRYDMMLKRADVPVLGALVQKAALISGAASFYNVAGRLAAKAHLTAAQNSLFWYRAIRRVTGASVLIDSSKDVRREKVLYYADPTRFRMIHLVRDGRAVTASHMRREGVSMAYAARIWAVRNWQVSLSIRGIPSSAVMLLRYEDLCQDTSAILARTCDFVGLPFETAMLNLNKSELHTIGGNPMRLRTAETDVRLDERWREELSPGDLRTFDKIAGAMNRRFGYAQ